MKTIRLVTIITALMALLHSCAPRYGCPANSVGAENAESKHQSRMSSGLRKF